MMLFTQHMFRQGRTMQVSQSIQYNSSPSPISRTGIWARVAWRCITTKGNTGTLHLYQSCR